MRIKNVMLPNKGLEQRFDVEVLDDKVQFTADVKEQQSDPPTLLLPALCHPHIHLDKAYLLTSHPKPSNEDEYPDYSDLILDKGDFSEALAKTAEAKTRYTVPDLLFRGSQLIAESVQAGVTSMRAFAEVDHVTKFKCLEAAVQLKRKFSKSCYVQICAFAQDPIMSTDHGGENLKLMEQALEKYQNDIEVLGSTPYVEADQQCGVENMRWAIKKAIGRKLHLDFHLDYNTNHEMSPLIWSAIRTLKEEQWMEKAHTSKRIVFGHCSRLTIFDKEDMEKLANEIADLPVAFVGLPTSDLFMMGRPVEDAAETSRRERGTLQAIEMIQSHMLQVCIGVNNTGNAFTPWGSADPLRLASLGVGLYHAGTPEHARILYECVSTRARRAIGLQRQKDGTAETQLDDFDLGNTDGGGVLAIVNEKYIRCAGLDEQILARQRLTVTDVVWDPPEPRLRQILRGNNS